MDDSGITIPVRYKNIAIRCDRNVTRTVEGIGRIVVARDAFCPER